MNDDVAIGHADVHTSAVITDANGDDDDDDDNADDGDFIDTLVEILCISCIASPAPDLDDTFGAVDFTVKTMTTIPTTVILLTL